MRDDTKSEDMPFARALIFVTERHGDHVRKRPDGCTNPPIPYISHLLQVAGLVLEYGGDTNQVIAGLLHDTIEDGKATEAELRDLFDGRIVDMVVACSDTDQNPKPRWFPRKHEYIERLRKKSPDDPALLVSAADKLHNARAITQDVRLYGDATFRMFSGRKAGTIWYYRALIDAYRELGVHRALVDELNRTVGMFESLAYDR